MKTQNEQSNADIAEKPKKVRWNWKHWQELVKRIVNNAEALAFAEVWPQFTREYQNGIRPIWAHEIQYLFREWLMNRVMHAVNILEEARLSSRYPGTPLYAPTMPKAIENEGTNVRQD